MRTSREILRELKTAREHVTDLEREFKDIMTMKRYKVAVLTTEVSYTHITAYSKDAAFLISKRLHPGKSVISIELEE